MTKKYDFIVIGDGIVGRAILYFLVKKYPSASIAQLSNEEAFPSCSRRTTSVVSLGLFEEGISKLGNILFNASNFFEDFVKKHAPAGVSACKQYYIPPDIKSDPLKFKQFEARYGSNFVKFKNLNTVAKDAYLINPTKFLDFFKDSYSDKVEVINARVVNVAKGRVETLERGYSTNKVILATSAYTNLFFKDDKLPEGKPVKGTYYSWDIDLNQESFVISRGHYNLIYRSEDHLLLFGANSIESLDHLHSTSEVSAKFDEFLKDLPEFNFLDRPMLETGIRHKGRRRTPFVGEVSEGIYALNGLYKNGWSAGISLSYDLVELI